MKQGAEILYVCSITYLIIIVKIKNVICLHFGFFSLCSLTLCLTWLWGFSAYRD